MNARGTEAMVINMSNSAVVSINKASVIFFCWAFLLVDHTSRGPLRISRDQMSMRYECSLYGLRFLEYCMIDALLL